jgi:hypothetical protein
MNCFNDFVEVGYALINNKNDNDDDGDDDNDDDNYNESSKSVII